MDINPGLQSLVHECDRLWEQISGFLQRWKFIEKHTEDPNFGEQRRDLFVEVRQSANNAYFKIRRHVVYGEPEFKRAVDTIENEINRSLNPGASDTGPRNALNALVDLIRSVPTDVDLASDHAVHAPIIESSYVPGTAFILMWMDKSKPDLEDVALAFKEGFDEFGIKAQRADDIEHQDVVTQVILEQIASAEFLIADLTGERPNVYYEVGYAHAIGKRPILFRKAGTRLHFDLSVHNVPEYKNITELRKLLRSRLESMTGKQPRRSRRR